MHGNFLLKCFWKRVSSTVPHPKSRSRLMTEQSRRTVIYKEKLLLSGAYNSTYLSAMPVRTSADDVWIVQMFEVRIQISALQTSAIAMAPDVWTCRCLNPHFKHRHFKHRTSAAKARQGKSLSGCRGADKYVRLSDPLTIMVRYSLCVITQIDFFNSKLPSLLFQTTLKCSLITEDTRASFSFERFIKICLC